MREQMGSEAMFGRDVSARNFAWEKVNHLNETAMDSKKKLEQLRQYQEQLEKLDKAVH